MATFKKTFIGLACEIECGDTYIIRMKYF